MCGSLRRENNSDLVGKDPQPVWGKKGESFPVVSQNGRKIEAIFDNFARQEGISDWHKHGWTAGDLIVSGFTEGYRPPREYEIPKGYAIKCITLMIPGRGYVMKIQTRCAVEKERAVHDRFPVVTKRRY